MIQSAILPDMPASSIAGSHLKKLRKEDKSNKNTVSISSGYCLIQNT